jgi:AcrR family transcriptional regulator
MQLYCISMGDDVKTDVKRDTAAPTPGQDLRAARVARTEAQLIAAATELFLERGYVATTLVQIALHAGIAPRTVYLRFGTKAALFRRVLDRALVGDAEPIAVADRPGTQIAMTAKTLHQRIEALVEVSAGIVERAGALFEVAAQAEGIEPEVAEAAQAGRRATAELCATFWARATADGLLDRGTDTEALAVATDVLICADTVVHLRRTRGWTGPEHRALITQTLAALARPRG